jgi:hypothetical protein
LIRNLDASHVIGLFPGLLPPEFRHQIEYPGTVPELRGADLENGMSSLIVFLTNVSLLKWELKIPVRFRIVKVSSFITEPHNPSWKF